LHTALFFLGNSTYLLAGFAPTRRKRLDDGLIDVRILETGRSLSKLRVMTSIMFGRLARSPLYHEHHGGRVQLHLTRRAHCSCPRR
jgi:diacylglycerol kinase family enzyme